MTKSEAKDWRSRLPEELIRRAFASGCELAWQRNDAINVVRLLQNQGYRVIDVEVWLATSPGPTPTMDIWDERNSISATEFIESFAFAADDPANIGLPPYFNILVD